MTGVQRSPTSDTSTGATASTPDAVDRPPLSQSQFSASTMVIAAMATIATVGFGAIFSNWNFLSQSLVGAALGALVILAARRFQLLLGESLAIALIVPLIAGPIAAGGTGFYSGLIYGWADILSATPPVDATDELRALPFIAAYIGSVIGSELARLRELPGLGIVGPLATLSVTALFSEQTRTGALAVGLVLLVGLLLLSRLYRVSLTSTGVLLLALVIGFVGVLASTTSLILPVADEDRRFDLRDLQEPPWDPLEPASPITLIKGGLKGPSSDQTETPILRISGPERVSRWRTASLPSFNGVNWAVAEPDTPASFVAVDSKLPLIPDEVDAQRSASVTFAVDVLDDIGHWVPTGGVPSGLDFDGAVDARMNLRTGTVGIPGRLGPGDSYGVTFSPWVELDDAELGAVTFVADNRAVELELLPPVVRNLAADFSTGIGQLSGRRVIAIRDNFRLGSYDLETPPGHSFGRVAEFLQAVKVTGNTRVESDLRPLQGYEELYSASAAVLSRLSDIPSRVAVGYVIPEDRWVGNIADVYATDTNAWIEVHIDGRGWMPIDVTPLRSRDPQDVDLGVQSVGVPVADPPKEPPPPEDEVPPEVEEPEQESEEETEEPEEEEEDTPRVVRIGTIVSVAILTPLLVLMVAAAGVFAFKRMRRGRRRSDGPHARRIAGAWAELIDRIREAGEVLPAGATPAEAAEFARGLPGLGDADASERVGLLADQVSAAAFHPEPPTADAADEAWEHYEMLASAMADSAGASERIKRSIDPRPIFDDALVDA